jgi:hypothetical protein
MEVIVGLLAALIVGSILLHLGRMGFAMYKLSAATDGIAEELEGARTQALERHMSISVIFKADERVFGVDRNGNGDLTEAGEKVPAKVNPRAAAEEVVLVPAFHWAAGDESVDR